MFFVYLFFAIVCSQQTPTPMPMPTSPMSLLADEFNTFQTIIRGLNFTLQQLNLSDPICQCFNFSASVVGFCCSTTSFGRISYLGFRNQPTLRGSLSPAASKLTALEYVSFAGSPLQGPFPTLAPSLTHLTLTSSKMSSLPPMLALYPLLDSLTTSSSRITGDIGAFFALNRSSPIEVVQASSMPGFTGFLPTRGLFQNTPNLTTLLLTDVGVTNIPAQLGLLSAATRIAIRGLPELIPPQRQILIPSEIAMLAKREEISLFFCDKTNLFFYIGFRISHRSFFHR